MFLDLVHSIAIYIVSAYNPWQGNSCGVWIETQRMPFVTVGYGLYIISRCVWNGYIVAQLWRPRYSCSSRAVLVDFFNYVPRNENADHSWMYTQLKWHCFEGSTQPCLIFKIGQFSQGTLKLLNWKAQGWTTRVKCCSLHCNMSSKTSSSLGLGGQLLQ